MHCSGCGVFVNDNLNYCNSCGTKLSDSGKSEELRSMMISLLTTVFLTLTFGLGLLVGLITILLGHGVDEKGITLLAMFWIAAIFGICFMIMRQIPKLIDARLSSPEKITETGQSKQISAPDTARLNAPREAPASVTDNTTRTLDEVLLRRN